MTPKETPTQELATTEGRAPADMIRLAVMQGADLDKLRQAMELHERWEANEARKAYNQAMAAFKANPPKIKKDKKVKYGGGEKAVGYSHASLGNVTEKINTELSKYGLSASWSTKQNGNISVTCRITHKLGHSEETTLSAAADTSGAKNSIQAIGSTITYLERYTLLGLCGLATFDQDDDGCAAVTAFISEKQMGNILDLIAEKEADTERFCKYMQVESIAKIPASKYQQAIAALNEKKKPVAK